MAVSGDTLNRVGGGGKGEGDANPTVDDVHKQRDRE